MSANRLAYLLETSKIDWSNLTVGYWSGTRLFPSYELSPETFLNYAELDFKSGGTRGYINALSNAKRAMDCQVDGILAILGFSPDALRRQVGRDLTATIEGDSPQSSLPFNYRFLESLGGVTPGLVERIRHLRHDLEHRFQRPTKRAVREAIDVASLFVAATKGLTIDFCDQFSIDSRNTGGNILHRLMINLAAEDPDPHAEARFVTLPKTEEFPLVRILPNHAAYYWAVRIGLVMGEQADVQPLVRNLIASTGAKITKSKIKVKAYD